MRVHHGIARSSGFNGRLGRITPQLTLEALETRKMLTLAVTDLHLASDTGSSSTDKITSAGTIVGNAGAMAGYSGVVAEFDHNGDGSVDGTSTNFSSNGTFSYDAVAHDSALQSWENTVNIKCRLTEYDGYGGIVERTDWQNFNFTLDRVAPTTSGLTNVNVNEGAADTTINLNSVFADGVTSDSSLVYSIISNSNPGLFDSVSINSGSGVLTLDYKPTGYGIADIGIRATDQAGNYRDTNLHVTVNHVNLPPVVTSFTVTAGGSGLYDFSGTITDDGDVDGLVVFIYISDYDVLEASVDANGYFGVAGDIPLEYRDYAVAWTYDYEDVASEMAWDYFS
jgi:hypothetical protein